jgi:aryl-alcohol dehydrogenase-like predicted oxidoreductase
METMMSLGKSSLRVPRLGLGVMTWGDAKGLARFHPAKMAYGGAQGYEEEKQAFEASQAAQVNFDTGPCTAAEPSALGELGRGRC